MWRTNDKSVMGEEGGRRSMRADREGGGERWARETGAWIDDKIVGGQDVMSKQRKNG